MAIRRKRTAKPTTIEALIGSDRELLKTLVKESLHQVLEAEMTEAVGAGPGSTHFSSAPSASRRIQRVRVEAYTASGC